MSVSTKELNPILGGNEEEIGDNGYYKLVFIGAIGW